MNLFSANWLDFMAEWRTIRILMDVSYIEVLDHVSGRLQTDDTPGIPIPSLADITSLFVVKNHSSASG